MSLYGSCLAIGPVYHGERCKVMFKIFPGLKSPLVIGQEEGLTSRTTYSECYKKRTKMELRLLCQFNC
jgi:hypothetical protein